MLWSFRSARATRNRIVAIYRRNKYNCLTCAKKLILFDGLVCPSLPAFGTAQEGSNDEVFGIHFGLCGATACPSDGPRVPIRVGVVHASMVYIGTVNGEEEVTDISILGNASNTAARLASLPKKHRLAHVHNICILRERFHTSPKVKVITYGLVKLKYHTSDHGPPT